MKAGVVSSRGRGRGGSEEVQKGRFRGREREGGGGERKREADRDRPADGACSPTSVSNMGGSYAIVSKCIVMPLASRLPMAHLPPPPSPFIEIDERLTSSLGMPSCPLLP